MDIKKVIQDHGWTLERLAKEMTVSKGQNKNEKGISQAAVSQIINGNPQLDRLKEIAGIIGIPVSELLSEGESQVKIKCPKCGADITIKAE